MAAENISRVLSSPESLKSTSIFLADAGPNIDETGEGDQLRGSSRTRASAYVSTQTTAQSIQARAYDALGTRTNSLGWPIAVHVRTASEYSPVLDRLRSEYPTMVPGRAFNPMGGLNFLSNAENRTFVTDVTNLPNLDRTSLFELLYLIGNDTARGNWEHNVPEVGPVTDRLRPLDSTGSLAKEGILFYEGTFSMWGMNHTCRNMFRAVTADVEIKWDGAGTVEEIRVLERFLDTPSTNLKGPAFWVFKPAKDAQGKNIPNQVAVEYHSATLSTPAPKWPDVKTQKEIESAVNSAKNWATDGMVATPTISVVSNYRNALQQEIYRQRAL